MPVPPLGLVRRTGDPLPGPGSRRELGSGSRRATQARRLTIEESVKWSAQIVVRLGKRTHRFDELHREVDGISRRMLTCAGWCATAWSAARPTSPRRRASTTNSTGRIHRRPPGGPPR
ncbi:winged helix-turn-helix transcriptional regulator [Streptomyces sp. NPDC007162]|uniref:winged helix-turn-helix transcriptional regulator n=1 Tax=Streptomyces sp. NPDC007162 TaxID=3156917 RepID=UPI0033E6F9C3